jgi:hypothetical protein
MTLRPLFLLAGLCIAGLAAADDVADAFWAKQNKDALRALERGKPAQQIEAAERLGHEFAEQTGPVLARHLAHADPTIRRAAAEALWEMSGHQPDAFAALQPALRTALDDADAAVAMNAAGALASMGVSEAELAPARRRVLSSGVSGYIGFLAARGLIGRDPAPPLLPYLLNYYLEANEAAEHGGSSDNRDIGERALAALVATGDRNLIDPLQRALTASPPATPFLLKQLHVFKPKPTGWTDTLLSFTQAAYPAVRERAWDLLGDQRDAASLEAWAPRAAQLLADPEMRKAALGALADAAGRTPHGLNELAALANQPRVDDALRVRAIEVIADAADSSNRDGVAAVQASARRTWEQVCTPILKSHAVDDYFKACRNDSAYIVRNDGERAQLIASWLDANTDVEAKVTLLGSLESMWDKARPAVASVRAQRSHADARVVQAAEAALNRIEPAWRERDARGEAPRPAAAASPAAVAVEKPSGKGADGASLYAAIAKGDVAAVKRLVNAGNVELPVRYPQMQGTPPKPIVVAMNYCGIPQAEAGLKAIVEYLMGLGANPDVSDSDGRNLLDHAKYVCPPDVLALLAR